MVVEELVDSNGKLVVNMFFAWITSFYWSVTTMTTVGYGDISAGTALERIIACIAMCIGALLNPKLNFELNPKLNARLTHLCIHCHV
jgi:hypothetical protein